MMRDHTTLQDFALRREIASRRVQLLHSPFGEDPPGVRRGREVGSIGGGGAAAYVDGVVGCFDNLLSLGVVKGQLVETEWKLHCLRLAGVESEASKALEIAYRLLCADPSDIDIALDNLGGTAPACIGDCGGCDDGLALLIAHKRG